MLAESGHACAPFLFDVIPQLRKAGLQISNSIIRRMRKTGDVWRQTRPATTVIEEQLHERHGTCPVEHASGGSEQIEALTQKFLQGFSLIGRLDRKRTRLTSAHD